MLSIIQKKKNDIWEETGHLKETDFKMLLIECGYATTTIENKINQYRNFKYIYNNLSEWFEDEIHIRIGNKEKMDLNYRNRSYIFLLAILGVNRL